MIYNELSRIQKELKAPKGQFNKFGNYKYRSCEDILEAVKPLLGDCCLTISDDVVLIGDRYYIKATARLALSNEDFIENSAFAREAFDKKGMDESQITGASSSYARKYSLNGLFAIDDTKELDGDNSNREVETLPDILIKGIQDTKTVEELSELYKANKDDMSKELKQQFNTLVSDRKKELENENS